MAVELPEGYREVSPEDSAKAKVFFDRGRTVAATGNFEYTIEMFLQGLSLDPDAIEAHQELRDFAMKRKASGGKSIGMFEAMSLKRGGADDKANMLNAEKLLSYEPGNTSYMQSVMQHALRAGYYDTVMWLGPILQRANLDDKKPDYNKFIFLRDVYKRLKQYRLASDAAQLAQRMRPDDMDLTTEIKNLGAMDTMESAGYSKGGSFREQIRNREKQQMLLTGDKDFIDADSQTMMIRNAEAEYNADPNDQARLLKLVETYEKTEQPEYENKAIELLQLVFEKTRQFRFRQRIGQINIRQMSRMERSKREALQKDTGNPELRKDYVDFKREQLEFELSEFTLAAEAYPTDMKLKYEMARRLFSLRRFTDAIPIFQQVRMDPKYRIDAGMRLALSFFEAGYLDEAQDTLTTLVKDYQGVGDERSRDMNYWLGRTYEQKKMKQEALACYSKVAQMDFNYLDVQSRIKKLRESQA